MSEVWLESILLVLIGRAVNWLAKGKVFLVVHERVVDRNVVR